MNNDSNKYDILNKKRIHEYILMQTNGGKRKALYNQCQLTDAEGIVQLGKHHRCFFILFCFGFQQDRIVLARIISEG